MFGVIFAIIIIAGFVSSIMRLLISFLLNVVLAMMAHTCKHKKDLMDATLTLVQGYTIDVKTPIVSLFAL